MLYAADIFNINQKYNLKTTTIFSKQRNGILFSGQVWFFYLVFSREAFFLFLFIFFLVTGIKGRKI